MPPYSEVVFYSNTLRRLDPKYVGFLCWLIANSEPLGSGAWGLANTSHAKIGAACGASENTVGGYLKVLFATGYIHTVKQRGLGHKNGGVSQTHYLTYHPALPRPDGDDRDPKSRELKSRELKNRELKNSDLYVLPSHKNDLVTVKTGESSDQQDCLSVNLTKQNKEPQMPQAVEEALASIGWNFSAFPIPEDTDWEALMSVIVYTKRENTITAKARFVSSRLAAGITKSAKELGCTTQPFSNQQRMPESLSPLEYDILAEQYPQWDKEVTSKAAKRAREKNLNYIPPSLKWQIAIEHGLPIVTEETVTYENQVDVEHFLPSKMHQLP